MAGEAEFRKARAAALRAETALQANTRDEIVRLLREADREIRLILAGQPTDYQRWSLPQLQREIQRVLAQFGEAAASEISTASGRAWEMGVGSVEEPLRAGGAIPPGVSFHSIDLRQLLAMRAFATDRIKNVALEAVNKINAQLGLVVIGSQGPSDAIGAVTQILGEQSRARARTIVRTSLGQLFETSAFDRIGLVAAAVPGIQKQWRKSGKAHPRPHHAAIDGQIREVGEPFRVVPFGKAPVELMYPLDPAAPAGEVINCGCRMVAYKESWKIDRPTRAGEEQAGPSVRALLKEAWEEGKHPRRPKGTGGGQFTSKGLLQFAERARSATNVHEKHDLGEVANHEAILAATGVDVKGFRHQADNFGVRHGFKHHGDESFERPRGQRAVKAEDALRFASTVHAPDSITHDGLSKFSRQPIIGFEKAFGKETLVYKAEVRRGRRELATQSFLVRVRK